jgi:LytS/YehU family sensor histidine kinase
MLITLINNIAFLIALVAAGQIVLRQFHNKTLNRQVLLGLLFGGVTLLGMLNPVTFVPGLIFDGRSIVLSVAGVVGGAITAAIAAIMAAIYRYQLGGIGAPVGVLIVVVSSLFGVLGACRTIKLVACFFEVIPSGVTESTFKTIAERVSGETILLCCRSTSATEISVGFAAYPAANTCILFKL